MHTNHNSTDALAHAGFCVHTPTHTCTHKQNALPVLITGYLNCLKGIIPVRGWISNQRLEKSDRDRKQKEE